MNTSQITTPFGRRTPSLGEIAVQARLVRAINGDDGGGGHEDAMGQEGDAPKPVNKWQLFRALTELREVLGVSDRTLSVLNALLTFHPEAELEISSDSDDVGLIVFPSNRQLALRSHGMADATLRRHLAALVQAGLIIRRDSPNGKRYQRKARAGEETGHQAYGFDLAPLVMKAQQFDAMCESKRQQDHLIRVVKERVSLHRRDIAKLIELGLETVLQGDWAGFTTRLAALGTPPRICRNIDKLRALEAELSNLKAEVLKCYESCFNLQNLSGNDNHSERHHSNSNTDVKSDFEPSPNSDGVNSQIEIEATELATEKGRADLPLGLVLEACPDVKPFHFASSDIRNWKDFVGAAAQVRPMIGISPHAWADAVQTMGEQNAAIAVATILQRSEHSSESKSMPGARPGSSVVMVNGSPAIFSAGGYLRALTEKAKKDELALGSIVMALIGQRMKAKRLAKDQAKREEVQ